MIHQGLGSTATDHTLRASTLCKEILSHKRDDIRLWDTYARVLSRRSRQKEASAIYEKALESLPSPRLWRSQLELTLRQDEELAIHILVMSVDKRVDQFESSTLSPQSVLRAQNRLESMLESEAVTLSEKADVIICLTWLKTHQENNRESACDFLETHCKAPTILSLDSYNHECLCQNYARFLIRAQEDPVWRPRRLISFLEWVITVYPRNSLFW